MNNFCVTSQLDDMLMSSAPGSEGGAQNQPRRDSIVSSADKNYNLVSNRLSKRGQNLSFFQKSGFAHQNAKKLAIVNQANKQFGGIPEYLDQAYFQSFLKANEANVNEGTGYMFISLDKPYYRLGETVKGIVYFELFHQSSQNELFIKFEGVQILPINLKKKVMGFEDSSVSSQESERKVKNLSSSKISEKVSEEQETPKQFPRKFGTFQIDDDINQRAKQLENLQNLTQKVSKLGLSKKGILSQGLRFGKFNNQNSVRSSLNEIDKKPKQIRDSMSNNGRAFVQKQNNEVLSSSSSMHYISNFKRGAGKRRNSVDVPESDTISVNGQNILDYSDEANSMKEGGESSSENQQIEESQVSLEKENEKFAIFPMFQEIKKLFQFRGKQQKTHFVKKGQYSFPFTFTIPRGYPSSAKFVNSLGELFQIKYSVQVEFKGKILNCSREIVVIQERFNFEENRSQKIDTDTSFIPNRRNRQIYEQFEKLQDNKIEQKVKLPNLIFPRFQPNDTELNSNMNSRNDIVDDDFERQSSMDQNEELRLETLKSQDLKGLAKALNLCCGCYSNVQVEIAMFKKIYEPNEKIQALVNFGSQINFIKKITMSLYIKIELKSPDNPEKIIKTISDRIYQITFDCKNNKKNQDSTIMEIDLERVQHFYQNKQKDDKIIKLQDMYQFKPGHQILEVPGTLKTVGRKFSENELPQKLPEEIEISQSQSSYRDINQDIQLIELEKSQKNVNPISSDGMIMRISYSIRFDLTKREIFNRKKEKRVLKETDLKLARRENNKLNNERAYVEFPIQITYPDSKEEFVNPLRTNSSQPLDSMEDFDRISSSIDQKLQEFLVSYPQPCSIIPPEFKPVKMPGSHFNFSNY